ncbi:MAG TPA: hypothetical protein VK116_14980, partial [Planctomycetota bacterium]|nr:hypothetical protein [Planctomycetota bacterium]
YALVVAGVPVWNPVIQRNFELLHKQALASNHTYTIACYIFALDAAIAQVEHDAMIIQPKKVREALQEQDNPALGREYRPHLAQAVQAMIRLRNKTGVWRYTVGQQDFDNSNVQFAVLALGVGAKRRVPIPTEVWESVLDHFLKGQEADGPEVKARLVIDIDRERERHRVTVERARGGRKGRSSRSSEEDSKGRTVVSPTDPEIPIVGTEGVEIFSRGWNYAGQGNGNWNMTCAGLSSLLLARDNLYMRLNADQKSAVNKAIRDGYAFLMRHWQPHGTYYGVYSLEKVADIGNVIRFDDHDWYEEVSKWLLEQQEDSGGWPKGAGHGESPRVSTSFALLVLNRATSLLTMNPASLIVVSGRDGGGEGGVADRSWVYVPDLDARLHFPTLIRTIAKRPHLRLIQFLENIVEHYPEEWKGELIPELAKVRAGLPDRSPALKLIDRYLADIAGAKYPEYEKYVRWHERWKEVIDIGKAQDTKRKDELIAWYGATSESFPLKKAITWSIIQCKVREALPLFLDEMAHSEPRVRENAYNAFRSFFFELPPPFDPLASARDREAQIARVRAWYERQTSS